VRYLVTGGLGVVGSRFAEWMCKRGHDVLILDACEAPRSAWMAAELVKRYPKCTARAMRVEKADLGGLLADADAVLHAAAHTGIPHSAEDPTDDWISNVEATRLLLEAARRLERPPPIVALSSVKPYRVHDLPTEKRGNRTECPSHKRGIDETCLLEPDEPYAASKMAQSALVMAYARTYNLPATVLRCSNLYGDAPCHGPRHGWLTWFSISAALDWTIEVQGTGRQTRDVLFSDDVAGAVSAALGHIIATRGNVYNLGGGPANTISCLEAVATLSEWADVRTRPGPGRAHEDMWFATCHNKFTQATGWRPTVPPRAGMRRIFDWARTNADALRELYGTSQ
jgi:CDP-paratose 2-epimerase